MSSREISLSISQLQLWWLDVVDTLENRLFNNIFWFTSVTTKTEEGPQDFALYTQHGLKDLLMYKGMSTLFQLAFMQDFVEILKKGVLVTKSTASKKNNRTPENKIFLVVMCDECGKEVVVNPPNQICKFGNAEKNIITKQAKVMEVKGSSGQPASIILADQVSENSFTFTAISSQEHEALLYGLKCLNSYHTAVTSNATQSRKYSVNSKKSCV